ncbi:MAG: cobyrinate a,c-diamide synthase [Desulfobacula sp.]|nr:cobyrinate a,c-diamide synthase [Desulfobacula sp.]
MLAYLVDAGYKTASFKIGPDFIDPGHHRKITGKTSFNLDSWMLSRKYNTRVFKEKTNNLDIAVIEGVMGLFDGYDALEETGSTAQMAKWLDLPVVLVINAGGMARSAAAIVKGFEEFDQDLKIAGVIFSKTGSKRHYEYLKNSVEQNCKTKCLGFMPKNSDIIMPERHLGLVTADEFDIKSKALSSLISMVKDHIDMPALINDLDGFDSMVNHKSQSSTTDKPNVISHGPIATIAVARDKAFCFYYQDNIDILKKFGAKILEFSPLGDDKLPENIDGIYFGGGYPEMFAAKLSKNRKLLTEIKEKSCAGMPLYGECGGFMFLCNKLCTPNDTDDNLQHSMSGCFDFNVKMSKKLRSLGYREITFKEDCIIGKKGEKVRGHEFHYSSLENSDIDISNVYKVTSRAGQDISLKGYNVFNTLGSYLHIHFGSNENCARQFVDSCTHYKKTKLRNVI